MTSIDPTISGRLVLRSDRPPSRVVADGKITVEDGHIATVEAGERGIGDPDVIVMPGFVDIHCHGGGGASFASSSADECRAAAGFHLRRGTTRMLASLVSASPAQLLRSCEVLADLVDDGDLVGIHLEGPFLSPERRGAHDPAALQHPDLDLLNRLRDASAGTILMVTVAPELDGGFDVVEWCRSNGVIAAIGHTGASAEITQQAIDAGATVATHLCNAMPSIHHRRPGPVPVLLNDERVVCELILDGHHVVEPVADLVLHSAGPTRVASVSDAIAATGLGDGDYLLGSLPVRVDHGAARLVGSDTLAGSIIGSADAVATALAWGWPLADVAEIHATTPGRLLGLDRAIEAGAVADLVVLDAHTHTVRRVMRDGRWVA